MAFNLNSKQNDFQGTLTIIDIPIPSQIPRQKDVFSDITHNSSQNRERQVRFNIL